MPMAVDCFDHSLALPPALNIEHIRAKARGGTNRVSNLTLACVPCNQAKDARSVE